MFIYISIFVGILLALVIYGYCFLPESQFSLSFSKRNFIITVVVLSAIFLYLLGMGIYEFIHPHETVKIVHMNGEAHLVDGIDGKIMILQDTKIHAAIPYKTVLFTWKPFNKGMTFTYHENNSELTKLLHLKETNNLLYKQIKQNIGAKYVYSVTLNFASQGKFRTIFGNKQNPLGTITVDVYK